MRGQSLTEESVMKAMQVSKTQPAQPVIFSTMSILCSNKVRLDVPVCLPPGGNFKFLGGFTHFLSVTPKSRLCRLQPSGRHLLLAVKVSAQ